MSDQAAAVPQPDNEERSQSNKGQEGARGSSSSSSSGGSGGGRPRHRRRHQGQSQTPQQQTQQRSPEPAINLDELRELMELIDSHGFTDFELEREGFRIRLGRNVGGGQAVAAPSAYPSAAPPAQAARAEMQDTEAGHAAQSSSMPPHPGAQRRGDARHAG